MSAPTYPGSVLKVGSTGAAVREVQAYLNKIGHNHLKVDGAYGHDTQHVVAAYQHHRGLTSDGQVGPRTWERMFGHGSIPKPPPLGKGASAAIKWAHSQLGVSEHPYGANWGHPVQDWIKFSGYGEPEPWCACFATVALYQGGVSLPKPSGYCPTIESWGDNGQHHLKTIHYDERRPGDLQLFDFGSGIAQHIGITDESRAGTYEGNTSPGSEGSQDNGGEVAHHQRGPGSVRRTIRVSWSS